VILVDTSVWVDHLRSGDEDLAMLLSSQVLMHPFILGELVCDNLRQRVNVLALLKNLPQAIVARDEEVLFFIERHALMSRGIGYVDAQLLATVVLDGGARLWTRDKRLHVLAVTLGMAYAPYGCISQLAALHPNPGLNPHLSPGGQGRKQCVIASSHDSCSNG
jgi:predicted nucleic acid-binding protein